MLNTYRVYTLKLAEYLTARGHVIVKTIQDVKKTDFLNWLFEDTPKLRKDIDEYQEERHRNL